MAKISYGPWLKERFIEAGDKGLVFADLFQELKDGEDGYRTTGTYNSFARFMYWYQQLKYIRFTDSREPSYQKGGESGVLKQMRKRFAITPAGERAFTWVNPLRIKHPEWAVAGEKKKEYMREYMREYRRRRWELLGLPPRGRGRPPRL